MTPRLVYRVVGWFTLVVGVPSVAAQVEPPPIAFAVQELVASDAVGGEWFGHAVALHDSLAVVGAPLANVGEDDDAGAVYLFRRHPDGTWREVQKLVASDPAAGARFGWSISLVPFWHDSLAQDSLVVVGAPGARGENGEATGAAYIFVCRPDGVWHEVQRLAPSVGAASASFGWSVAVADGWYHVGDNEDSPRTGGRAVVVGAPHAEGPSAEDTGLAYVFERQADGRWEETVLDPPGGNPGDQFGWSAAFGYFLGVVGAPQTPREDGGKGLVYGIQKHSSEGWSVVVALEPSVGEQGDEFGYAIDMTHFLLVSAPGDPVGGTTGIVHEFRDRPPWGPLTPFRGADGAGFGVAVVRGWGWMAIGRVSQAAADENLSAVALYRRAITFRYIFRQWLHSPSEAGGDAFGSAVDISQPDGVIAVGAPLSSSAAPEAGAVFLFTESDDSIGTGSAKPPLLPDDLRVDGPFPNPTAGTARLTFSLKTPGPVVVQLFDVRGRLRSQYESWHAAGAQELVLQTGHLPSGVYAYRVTAGAQHRTGLLTVLR